MKFLLLVILSAYLYGCSSASNDASSNITGNWLIVFPDHQLETVSERKVYAKYQDSIVALYGLKLISFSENGEFKEMDSILKQPARWRLGKKDQLTVQEGGRGFNPFRTSFEGFKNDTLRLVQELPLEDENITIVWYLKKIKENDSASQLFSIENNWWRKKPSAPESEAAIKKRLIAVLNYYSSYFMLIGTESRYFSAQRVPLPLRYYQHAVGMKTEMQPSFTNLFYDDADAMKAYGMLTKTVNFLANKFDWGKNFAIEYGMALKKIAFYMAD